jgi:porin
MGELHDRAGQVRGLHRRQAIETGHDGAARREQGIALKQYLLAFALLAEMASSRMVTAGTDWQDGDQVFSGERRSELASRGYTFFASYNAIVANNVSGGIHQDSDYAQDIYFGTELDLERLLGWSGTTFRLTGIDRAGNSIDGDVGSIYSVMQLVGGQTYFLYGVSLEKQWWNEQLSFKFGRITATDDFAGSPLYGFYLNNSIDGQIRAVLLDGVMTSYPFPVWGARVAFSPTPGFEARVGVYQLTENMFVPNKHGMDFAFRGSDGVSVFTELDWLQDRNDKPGHFAVGVNSVSFNMPEFTSDETTDAFFRYYLQADQQVYQESPGSDQGLVLFLTLAYSTQQQAALVPFQTSVGAIYKGLLPGRNEDRLIFGATYGCLSNDYGDRQQALGQGNPTYEMPLELGYRMQLTRFAYIQPDIQYVIRPGGSGDIPDATVLGVQFGASF